MLQIQQVGLAQNNKIYSQHKNMKLAYTGKMLHMPVTNCFGKDNILQRLYDELKSVLTCKKVPDSICFPAEPELYH